jgi:hypothetical protein
LEQDSYSDWRYRLQVRLLFCGHCGASTEAEVEPPPRHVVELGELRCDCQGMVLVEHGDAGAEHDLARLADRAGDDLYRAGNPRIVRRQMRADPTLRRSRTAPPFG